MKVLLKILLFLPMFFINVAFAELTLSGVGHVSTDVVDNDVYFASNSSRIAVHGALGSDHNISALFHIESGINIAGEAGATSNDGNGSAASGGQLFTAARDNYVGLETEFGKILMGRLAGLNQWLYKFNLFADQVGDLGNVWGFEGMPGRMDSAVQLSSTEIKGVTAAASWKPAENNPGTGAAIANLTHKHKKYLCSIAYAQFGMGVGNADHEALSASFSVALKVLEIGFAYQGETDAGGVPGNDRESFSVGGKYNINDTLKAKIQLTASNGELAGRDLEQYALGLDYQLNPKATVYAAYAMMNNSANVAAMVNNYGHGNAIAPNIGEDSEAFSFGIVYHFDTDLIKR